MNENTSPGRRSVRLPGYDYGSAGAYFVTICAYQRALVFEKTEVAEVIEQAWQAIPEHFPTAVTDAFVVMPNHVHGIVWIQRGAVPVGARHASPLRPRPSGVEPGSLGAIVGSFKAAVTRELRQRGLHEANLPVWQRKYYDRIIRNEDELNRIREYIVTNPAMWHRDAENPVRITDADYDNRWAWLERP